MLKKIGKGIANFEIGLVGFGILSLTIIIFINVLLRHIFGSAIFWVEEFSRYMNIWIVFVGSGLAVRRNLHVTMDAFYNILSDNVKRLLNIFIYFSLGIMSLYLSINGFKLVSKLFKSNLVSIALDWFPIWIVNASVPIGSIFMAIFYFELAWKNIRSETKINSLEEDD